MPLAERALDGVGETHVVSFLQLAHVPALLSVPRRDRRFNLLGRTESLLTRRRLLCVVVAPCLVLRALDALARLLGCRAAVVAHRGAQRLRGAFGGVVGRLGFGVAHLLPSSQDLLRLGPYQRAPLLTPRLPAGA